MLQQAPEHAN